MIRAAYFVGVARTSVQMVGVSVFNVTPHKNWRWRRLSRDKLPGAKLVAVAAVAAALAAAVPFIAACVVAPMVAAMISHPGRGGVG